MTAGGGNDAEGTTIPTAVLHFEIRTRLAAAIRQPPILGHGKLRVGKCVVHIEGGQRDKARRLLGNLRYQRLMAVADHRVDAGQGSDLLRRPLRVTTGDQDARCGIFPVHAAQEGTGRTVGLRGHTAGIGDDHVGSTGAQSRTHAAMPQLSADHLAVGPAGSAAEVLYVVFCHVASLINGWMPLKRTPFQVGSDQAANFPRRPTATEPWSLFP